MSVYRLQMRGHWGIAPIALLMACFACKGKDSPKPAEMSPVTPATPAPPTPRRAVPAESLVKTEPLDPVVNRVKLEDLPAPFATSSASKGPNVVDVPKDATLRLPAGFTVNVYAEGLTGPRWLALTPSGEVLVTETPEDRITILADRDGDGVAEQRSVFAAPANGIEIPFGMAFAGGFFFVGNTAEVRRYPIESGALAVEGKGERVAELTPGGYRQHWTRNVVASPDGARLYVSIGSRTNVDVEPLPRAAVISMKLDGSDQKVVAHGLRNPVGLDFHPVSGELYATVNERDLLGDDLVPDYMTRIRDGEFFGWPFAYLSPNNLDPRRARGGVSENPELAAKTITPDVLFQAHSAALGIQFYDGATFPERYRGGAFVAFRGSWNRESGTGYKIVYVPFDGERPRGDYEDFLTGFLIDPSGPTTWGRPVGLLVLPDGSLLLTEEANGRIYRVQYAAPT